MDTAFYTSVENADAMSYQYGIRTKSMTAGGFSAKETALLGCNESFFDVFHVP